MTNWSNTLTGNKGSECLKTMKDLSYRIDSNYSLKGFKTMVKNIAINLIGDMD